MRRKQWQWWQEGREKDRQRRIEVMRIRRIWTHLKLTFQLWYTASLQITHTDTQVHKPPVSPRIQGINSMSKEKQRTENKLGCLKKRIKLFDKVLYVRFDCMDFRQPTSRKAWKWVSQEKLGQLPVWLLIKGPFWTKKFEGLSEDTHTYRIRNGLVRSESGPTAFE